MSELVLLHHNEPMTTSLAVAACTENEHASVLVMIQKYVDEFRSFGEVVFQIAEPGISRFQIGQREFEIANSRDKRGRPTEFAWLNEGQSTFLMTLLRNSPVVIQFKVALVKAFFELRDRLSAVSPAPTFGAVNHRADIWVSADRTFRAMMRSGRSAGLPLPSVLRRASEIAQRETGIDIITEMGVPVLDVPENDPDPIDRFVEEWMAGQVFAKCRPLPFIPCLGTHLYAHFDAWAHDKGLDWNRSQKKFIGHLAKLPGWSAAKSITTRKSLEDPTRFSRKMVIPSNTSLKRAAELRGEPQFVPPQGGYLEWVSRSFFTFAETV